MPALRFLVPLMVLAATKLYAQPTAIHNVHSRTGKTSLNGAWHYLVDPIDTGYRNHRNWHPFDAVANTKASASPYYLNRERKRPEERIEYDFAAAPTLTVPGDWNHQQAELLYYEGSVWYERDFEYDLPAGRRLFVHFHGANYRADVYVNGEKAGFHEGGFDPFSLEITDLVERGKNDIVVRVDNRREANRVPGLAFDWWNYGGLIRGVDLVETPAVFVRDYFLQLDKDQPNRLTGYVQLDGHDGGAAGAKNAVGLSLAGTDVSATLRPDADGRATVDLPADKLRRWSPDDPYRHTVTLSVGDDRVRDRIGLRTVETRGQDLLINGEPVFLRGICMHDENPFRPGRVTTAAESALLLGWVRELNANAVRLAHYPHNEYTVRLADSLGLLLWEEVPVYWGVNYTDPATYATAAGQLRSLIHRDKNRAATVIWSVANETPREDPDRLDFLRRMADVARGIDDTRLVSAALDRTEDYTAARVTITDPFAATTDVVSVNEYIGWYGSTPERIGKMSWDLSDHDKPLVISEFGAGALAGLRGPKEERWTVDHQAWMYDETLKMIDAIPNLRGVMPWILVDFRSPRRNLPGVQDGWNRKGVVGSDGSKKPAFYVLRDYYARKAAEYRSR